MIPTKDEMRKSELFLKLEIVEREVGVKLGGIFLLGTDVLLNPEERSVYAKTAKVIVELFELLKKRTE